jgi:hypothetical protein
MYVVAQDWCLSVQGNNEHFYDVSLISRFQSLWSLNAISDCFHLKAAHPEKPPGVSPFPPLQARFPIMSTTNLVNMLYKHTTQKLYICDPQTQLNNFFTLPKISLHVSASKGHLQVIFLKISYSTATHPSSLQV